MFCQRQISPLFRALKDWPFRPRWKVPALTRLLQALRLILRLH
jgi:hypothetical protein